MSTSNAGFSVRGKYGSIIINKYTIPMYLTKKTALSTLPHSNASKLTREWLLTSEAESAIGSTGLSNIDKYMYLSRKSEYFSNYWDTKYHENWVPAFFVPTVRYVYTKENENSIVVIGADDVNGWNATITAASAGEIVDAYGNTYNGGSTIFVASIAGRYPSSTEAPLSNLNAVCIDLRRRNTSPYDGVGAEYFYVYEFNYGFDSMPDTKYGLQVFDGGSPNKLIFDSNFKYANMGHHNCFSDIREPQSVGRSSGVLPLIIGANDSDSVLRAAGCYSTIIFGKMYRTKTYCSPLMKAEPFVDIYNITNNLYSGFFPYNSIYEFHGNSPKWLDVTNL